MLDYFLRYTCILNIDIIYTYSILSMILLTILYYLFNIISESINTTTTLQLSFEDGIAIVLVAYSK